MSGIIHSGHVSEKAIRDKWTSAVDYLRGLDRPHWTVQGAAACVTPAHQVFLSLRFLDTVQSAIPGDFQLYVSEASPGGEAEWVVALHTRRKGPFLTAAPPPFTPYTALATRAEFDFTRVVSHLDSRYAELRVLAPPQPHRADSSPSTALMNGERRDYATFIAPIAAADDLYPMWSANRRRTLKSYAADYVVDEEPAATADLAELVCGSYRRHGRTPRLSPDVLATLASRAITNDIARLFVARDADGVAEAAVGFLVSEGAAYYWLAGSKPGPAMTVLLGVAMPALYGDGVRAFDFVGANTPSIAEFKRRFGAVRQTYEGYYSVNSTPIRLVNAARSLLRRARRG